MAPMIDILCKLVSKTSMLLLHDTINLLNVNTSQLTNLCPAVTFSARDRNFRMSPSTDDSLVNGEKSWNLYYFQERPRRPRR